MMHYLRILKIQWRSSLSRLTIFRASALLGALYSGLFLLASILTVHVYFADASELGGWNKYEMYVLLGSFQLVVGLGEALFLWAQDSLPEDIVNGSLDFYLLRPVHSLFLVSTRELYIPGLLNLPIPLFLIIYGLAGTDWLITPLSVLAFAIAVAIGVLFYFLVTQFTLNICFWVENAGTITLFADELMKFGSRPRAIYAFPVQFALGYVFPVITIFNLPADILKRGFDWIDIGIVGLSAVVLWIIVLKQWKRGLRRYLGAGS